MTSEKVRVVVRVRPKQDQGDAWVTCIDTHTLHTFNHRNPKQTLAYEFESVFGDTSTQQAVYQCCVCGMLDNLFKGRNASVFAYGPTGAGKTHTILGSPTDPGIIPRCIRDVLELKKTHLETNKSVSKIDVFYSYLEIYQEKVQDLLCPGKDLAIREDFDKNIIVCGLTEKTIESVEDFNQSFGPASKNRVTATTKMNERSSRSHSVLILHVRVTQCSPVVRTLTSKLHIIDLAGSEDNRRTGNQGIRLRESGAINTSLLALSQVVDALNKAQPRIPYRGSKLTRLLQDSLGGNSHSCMIVNLAPEEKYYYDTYQTLNFARKTKKIVNVVKTNEEKQHTAEPKALGKRKLSQTSLDRSPSTPPKKALPAPVQPFLSPLMRNQERFKAELQEDIRSRLEELEMRLMDQMQRHSDSSVSDTSQGPESPQTQSVTKSQVLPSDLDRLEGLHKQLQQQQAQAGNAAKLLLNKHKVFSDGSTSAPVGLQDVTNSPLFVRPNVLKRKGFRSTASHSADSNSDIEEKVAQPVNELQQKHNDNILATLNSGKVAEIKKLQTIGGKKADVIAQWIQLNGALQSFDDLRKVGFSAANIQTFMRKNLINL